MLNLASLTGPRLFCKSDATAHLRNVCAWHIVDPAGPGCYTAVVTIVDGFGGSIYNTSSEYASNYLCTAYVSTVMK